MAATHDDLVDPLRAYTRPELVELSARRADAKAFAHPSESYEGQITVGTAS